MGKCGQCGRRGLFFKVGEDGICSDCRFENEQKSRRLQLEREIKQCEEKLRDTSGLLDEAMASAKTEAQTRLEAECKDLETKNQALAERNAELTAQERELVIKTWKANRDLEALLNRTAKIKPLADSIKYAYERWLAGDLSAAAEIKNLGIEELLPERELNCMTMKQLKSRYTALRKQIIELCTSYESRYTTKTNAAMYKLMVLALEAELENILHRLQYGKLDAAVEAVRNLTAKYYAIGADGNQSIEPTLRRFIGQLEELYLKVIDTEYEYYVKRERAREEQRAIREQMRQEVEDRKRLEVERKKVEAEEKKYQQEIERITAQIQQAHDSELETLRKRLAEMKAMIEKVGEKKAEIVNLQNGKAGTVYIISNIGSFGDHVFKVGMTRRLEPQDRVNELGDASVPFPFDVHSFIFSEDAVALENALHKELNDRRVNKVNLRNEFFNVSIEELQSIVERIDPTAPFKSTMLAEQYRQSLSIDEVPSEAVTEDEEEEVSA